MGACSLLFVSCSSCGGGNNSLSMWDIVMNNSADGFIMKLAYPSVDATYTFTCRPDGLCVTDDSDEKGIECPYTLKLIDDTHAQFYRLRRQYESTFEDYMDITYNPASRRCHADWLQVFQADDGLPHSDLEKEVGVTFELLK